MITIGDLQVDRVEEMCGPFITPGDFLVGLPENALARDVAWQLRHGYDSASGLLTMSIHSWIVRTRHHTILIDTCFGNDKERNLQMGHKLQTDWLDRLATKGLAPEDIDFVMCTHLHDDHVGWNTRLVDGRWVPTFPNARYVFARKEYDYWNPANGGADAVQRPGPFVDSVLPCVEAGQAEIVDDGYTLDDQLVVEAAPGHTPGTCVIRANGGGSSGLFVGDCMHSPLQVAYPEVNSAFCNDAVQARASRRRLLEDCAEHGRLLLPAHFPPPHAGHVRWAGDGFDYIPLG